MVLSSCICSHALGRVVYQGDTQVAGEVINRRLEWLGIQEEGKYGAHVLHMSNDSYTQAQLLFSELLV